jgi:hypothetical protein
MMPSGFIDDGYTLEKVIPADVGKYDSVTICYRPLLRREHWQYNKSVRDAEADGIGAVDELTAEMISKHLSSWSLKDREGNKVPITPENILRLQIGLFSELLFSVLGVDKDGKETFSDAETAKN